MKRSIQPEWLDTLRAEDPCAIRSRADLRRVNAWMGNAAILSRIIRTSNIPVRRIVEIGAGDGTLLLGIAQKISRSLKDVEVVLLDQQALVTPETLDKFQRMSWRASVVQADVFEWLKTNGLHEGDVVVTNLFLHHFEEDRLRKMFHLLAKKVGLFVACEPRRSILGLASARLLGLIGCNRVTRHDAVVSVVAGFREQELSRDWPADDAWNLREERAGWVSHLFYAVRKE